MQPEVKPPARPMGKRGQGYPGCDASSVLAWQSPLSLDRDSHQSKYEVGVADKVSRDTASGGQWCTCMALGARAQCLNSVPPPLTLQGLVSVHFAPQAPPLHPP